MWLLPLKERLVTRFLAFVALYLAVSISLVNPAAIHAQVACDAGSNIVASEMSLSYSSGVASCDSSGEGYAGTSEYTDSDGPQGPARANPHHSPSTRTGTMCNDGWVSGSTGSGTCSYHGSQAHSSPGNTHYMNNQAVMSPYTNVEGGTNRYGGVVLGQHTGTFPGTNHNTTGTGAVPLRR
jgi:hypothetical protein